MYNLKTMQDHKAIKILMNTYWSSAGWKKYRDISSENFDYARAAGYMFDPKQISHDDAVNWLIKSRREIELQDISNAFLSSLSTRCLELRSALGSYAVARHFPIHDFQGQTYCCLICGELVGHHQAEDLSVLNFERYKWGGVRHESPIYIAFDLKQFAQIRTVEPRPKDLDIMREILVVLHSCSSKERPRDLEERLSKVFKSNKAEREALIQILGYCGILESRDYPGYSQKFIPYSKREIPPVNKIDWTYPVCWWRGKDGVNEEAVAYFFPQLSI